VITVEQAQAALALLLPGFLALKIFAARGGESRRTDLEWTLWSLLVAALIGATLDLFGWPAALRVRLVPSLALGLLGGVGAVIVWKIWGLIHPASEVALDKRAWDHVFRNPHWVLLTLKDGDSLLGWPKVIADSKDTDDLDIYLERCEWVLADGTRQPLVNTKGMLVPRSEITRIQVLEPGEAIKS
jgi:uncharacterized protein DUF6338